MKPIHPHYILKKSVHFVESLFPILGILYRMHHRSFLSMTPLCSIKIICFVATDPIHLTMTAKVSCLTPLSSLFLIGPAASPSRLLSPAADPFLLHWLYVLYLFFKKVENLQPPSFFFRIFKLLSKLSAILANIIVSPSVHLPSFDASEHTYNMCSTR